VFVWRRSKFFTTMTEPLSSERKYKAPAVENSVPKMYHAQVREEFRRRKRKDVFERLLGVIVSLPYSRVFRGAPSDVMAALRRQKQETKLNQKKVISEMIKKKKGGEG
jgi:hypothetical protein